MSTQSYIHNTICTYISIHTQSSYNGLYKQATVGAWGGGRGVRSLPITLTSHI